MNRRGFTLLEVLVALSLTVMALSLVAMSISASLRAHERALEHLELIQTERETLNRIYRNLSVAYVSPYSQAASEEIWKTFDTDNAAEPFDALTFFSIHHRTNRLNAKESDQAAMTLFTREDEAREGPERTRLLVLREGGTMNDRFEVTDGVVYTLAAGLTRLSFDYLDTTGELRHEWRLEDRGRNLPCGVVVKMGLRSEHLEEISSCSIVPLILTGAQPCRFEKQTLDYLCQE